MTQVEEIRYWGYSNEWHANDASDAEVRSTVLQLLSRQRGDCINLKNIHRHLLLKGIHAHPTSLRGLVLDLGLTKVGESSIALAERYRIPRRLSNA